MNRHIYVLSILLLFSVVDTIAQDRSVLDSLTQQLHGSKTDQARFGILCSIAFEFRQSQPDSTIYFSQEALATGKRLGYTVELARPTSFLGIAHMNKGDFSEAYQFYNESLSLSIAGKDFVQAGHAHNNLGRLFLILGDKERAYNQFKEAEVIFQESRNVAGLAYVYRSYVSLLDLQQKYDSAIVMATKALEYRQRLSDQRAIISSLSELATMYRKAKQHEKAIITLQEVDDRLPSSSDPVLKADVRLSFGEVYFETGRYKEADEEIRKAGIYLSKTKNTYLNGRLDLLRAKVALSEGKIEKAIQVFKSVGDDSGHAVDLIIKNEAVDNLIMLFQKQGDLAQAENYQLYKQSLSKNIENQDLSKQLDKLNLRLDIEKLEKQKLELEKSNEKKESILKLVILVSVLFILIFLFLFILRLKRKREQEEDHLLLRTIIDNLPINVYVKNKKSQKIIANQAEWQYLGYTGESELMGKSDYDVYPTHTAEISVKEDVQVFSGNPMLGVETLNIKADGSRTWFLTSKVPLRNKKNEITGLVGISFDVTDRKIRETELQRLSKIVEQTTNFVMTTDVNGLIDWVNLSFEKVTGFSKLEVVGKNPGNFLQGEETNPATILYMRECVSQQLPFNCEVLNYAKDRTPYWVKISAQPTFNEIGEFEGYFSIQQDITHEKRLLEELQKAKDEAVESNRLKTIFLGNLSHEVRTPLQGIQGFAEVLENPSIPESKRIEYLAIIKRRAVDMQNIIESLLDMASLETGEIKPFPVDVNMNELIESVFAKIKQDHDLTGKGILLRLTNNLKPNTQSRLDPQHLHQVLVNLLGNARKFTTTGSISLVCEHEQSNLKISIIDTGIGIAPEKIEHIFKPFRQAHEGISRSKGGIGLGLAICKKMIELWGGEINVKSSLSGGSTFSFSIPCSEKDLTNEHESADKNN